MSGVGARGAGSGGTSEGILSSTNNIFMKNDHYCKFDHFGDFWRFRG